MGLADQMQEARGGRFVIGAGGLEAPSGKQINIQPNRSYWLGASTSPKHIFVTGVTDDTITFREYPYNKDQRIQAWIGRDLIQKGTTTHLQHYSKFMDPGLKASLTDMLNGGKGKPEKLSDHQPVDVLVKPAPGHEGEDLWYAAERYGGVGGLEIKGVMHYDIATDGARLKELKKDKKFTIVKTKNRS